MLATQLGSGMQLQDASNKIMGLSRREVQTKLAKSSFANMDYYYSY
jgi:hypothetical protein